jgi:hypothetical protein
MSDNQNQPSISSQSPNSENTSSEQDTHANSAQRVNAVPAVVVQSKTRTLRSARTDKGQTHFSRHGLLSRDLEGALIRLGEPIRNIRRLQRKYRSVFKLKGEIAELLFDKWWSCYLRQYLIAKLEAAGFVPGSSNRDSPALPVLEEGALPTLVYSEDDDSGDDFQHRLPDDLIQRLALTQRYDSHYTREGNRLFALLLLMRDGGEDALVKILRAMGGIR